MSDKAEVQFVDTNVLVYAFDSSTGEKHQKAKALIARMWDDHNGCISIQVLQEFYVNITRKVVLPLDADTAAQVVEDLSTWQVHIPDVKDVIEAIGLQKQHRVSFWDAMIIRSASQLDCGIIWSEDFSAGQEYAGVKVVNPFQHTK